MTVLILVLISNALLFLLGLIGLFSLFFSVFTSIALYYTVSKQFIYRPDRIITKQGLFHTDSLTNITRVDEIFLQVFRIKRDNVVKKKTVYDMFDTQHRDRIDSILESGGPKELHGVRNGDRFLALLNMEPWVNENGSICGYIGSVTDMDDEASDSQRKMYGHRLQSVGRMTTGIAHDFNNILGGVRTSLLILKMGIEDGNRTEELLPLITDIDMLVGNAADIINKLLTFSARNYVSKENIDFFDSVSESCNFTRIIVKNFSGFEVDIKHTSKRCYINSDSSLIQIIVQNLVLNSYHALQEAQRANPIIRVSAYMKKVHIPITSTFGNVPIGDYCCISVYDNGTGIDPSIMDKIFLPYYTTKPIESGTGLGLSLVWGVVSQHGGYIEINTKVDRFTEFLIYIPISPTDSGTTTHEKRRKITQVLLVDDDPGVLVPMSEYLEKRYGVTVFSFQDPSEALDFFKSTYSAVDLVITDMVMPNISGREFIEMCLSIDPDCEMVVMSGFVDTRDMVVMESMGVKHLKKPMDTSDIDTYFL